MYGKFYIFSFLFLLSFLFECFNGSFYIYIGTAAWFCNCLATKLGVIILFIGLWNPYHLLSKVSHELSNLTELISEAILEKAHSFIVHGSRNSVYFFNGC